MKYTTFTRRTNSPKLNWLERQLDAAGIRHRRNGWSWHAPILEVSEDCLNDAWKILTPQIDELPDDHELFWGE